ncbi:DUF3618 domain-containing protein [Yoonia litorea]|uniref:Membrane-anchored ribosome-binding protein, inhibits growth in stationary phase, ElaB/YqjD/DUF883 family n=1 Tax=Yoonia litorea TaxID=1123755 RepID=A0A1I6MZX6_9RHOB|nr:DUF3618 domain-containing protein [Yoonia litorea]SFS21253.1 Protein of unknown function [Yoonia litorea]
MSNIDNISREVEDERARLSQSLDALSDTIEPKALAQEATTVANDVATALAQQAWSILRNNPAGGVLVAAGLGLLATGAERRDPGANPHPHATPGPNDDMRGFDARLAAADAEMKAEFTGQMEPQPQASRLRETLQQGLDQLPPAARKRVVQARKAAIDAQEKVEKGAKKAVKSTKTFTYEQPLTVGALALGFGVLAGALLPGTRREDALLGERRDALMAEARRALEQEMDKAKLKVESTIARKTQTEQPRLHN